LSPSAEGAAAGKPFEERPLRNYIVRRILYSFLLLFLAATAIFFVLRAIPSGPFDRIQAQRAAEGKKQLPQSHMDRLNSLVGLDRPVGEQYVAWLGAMLRGDLGDSWAAALGQNVIKVVLARVPYTLLLILTSTVFALLLAVPAGLYSALHPYSDGDMLVTMVSFLSLAMPPFWVGLMLVSIFFTGLDWLPSGGIVSREMLDRGDILTAMGHVLTLGLTNKQSAGYEWQLISDGIKHLILPTMTLSLLSIARWSRFVRAAVRDILDQDFVRTAQAYGVPWRRIILRHVLRNGLIPLITVMTLDIPALFTGAIITEIVFYWPGIGKLYLDGIKFADWPLIQGLLIINTVLIVFGNLIADLSYAVADPRIKYA
jgi:peptide/nickel transport system permease protein